MLTGRSFPPPKLTILSLLLAAVLALAGPISASAEGEASLGVRAAAMARAGRCPDALALLDTATSESASRSLLRGKCQLELRRYPQAVASFEKAKQLDPTRTDVDLPLAMARFHQGDLVGARSALDAAAPNSQDDARFHLYRGLLLLQGADSASAVGALQRARDLNPLAVEPSASYYEGLALAGADQSSEAEEALQRVVELAPGTVWASEAEKAQDRLRGEAKAWWAWIKAGFEYDDNVVLRGTGVTLPQDISGEQDFRGVWTAHGGYEFLRTRDWSAGATFTYYGSAHFDLSEFDQHYPVLGFWIDRRLAQATTLRLRFDTGYAWVDGKPFLWNNALVGTVFHDWGREGSSKAFVGYYRSNYLFSRVGDVPDGRGRPFSPCPDSSDIVCGPPGIDEDRERNRDGDGIVLGIDHLFRVSGLKTEFTGGYLFDGFDARGSEWSYAAHEFWLETRSFLPWRVELRSRIGYVYKPFDNSSTFPDPRGLFFNREYFLQGQSRTDDIWYFRVELEKFLTDNLSASVRYGYLSNDSNVAVFDYDRQMIGAYVTYRFRP